MSEHAAAHSVRWLIPLLIFAGAWGTSPLLAPFRAEYLTLALVATAAAAGLLARIRRLSVGTLPAWIILGAFVLGYFVKFYVLVTIAADPSAVAYFSVTADRMVFLSHPPVALAAYRITVVGFAVFCAAYTLLPFPTTGNEGPHTSLRPETVRGKAFTAAFSAGFLLALTTAVALVLGVLVLGQSDEALPFRLVGVIFYTRTVLIVLLALLVLQIGLVSEWPGWSRVGILLLVAYAVSDLLVRSTRGSVVLAALAIALMIVVVRGGVERSARRVFAVLFAAALLLYPVITQYRLLRTQTRAGAEMFVEAFRFATRESTVGDLLWSGAAAFLTRFIGVDSLLFLTGSETRLGLDGVSALHASGSDVGLYFTRTVVGVPELRAHTEAPSLLGWFTMTGGWVGIVVGFALYLALGWAIWMAIWRSNLLVKPVAQVQFLLVWLTLSSEGTLDREMTQIPVMFVALVGLEMYMRAGRRRDMLPGPVPAPRIETAGQAS